MQKEMAELCIGALLHDIGKISERARRHLSEQSERMRPQICPTTYGPYSHHHVAHTNEFFENLKNWLPRELDPGRIANIASYHHKPSDISDFIVQEADKLSAGQDRRKDEKNEQQTGVRDYATSIFSSIPGLSGKGQPHDCILPLAPFSMGQDVYPRQLDRDNRLNSVQDYQALWEAMFSHFERLRPVSPTLYIEQLVWIYSLYAAHVPSHRSQHFEISLLDHSLTTAAFAAALYQYHVQTNTLNEAAIKDRTIKKFRMVSGDLSGIQNYLYHTTLENPSGVSKRLRSRSFYLGLVTRLAGELILEHVGLACVSRIIDAGGHFTLLIHNTEDSLKAVQEAEERIQHWFQKTFEGQLSLNLCYDMELSGQDFSQTRFHLIQNQLSWKMERAKKQPQRRILCRNGQWRPDDFVLEFDPAAMPAERPEGQEETLQEQFFNQIGSQLTSGNFLTLSTQPFEGTFEPPLAQLPLANPFGRYYFAITYRPPALNDTIKSCVAFVPGTAPKPLHEIHNGRFLANYIPRQTEEDRLRYENSNVKAWLSSQLEEGESVFAATKAKSFAHLCADAFVLDGDDPDAPPKGQPLLAVMKADVDRLGMLFTKGLEKAKGSLSYYISLSRQLDLFFSGIMPQMFLDPPAEHPDFRNIYTVYAGGDDLLLVGPWRTLLTFALYLRNQFRRYVCHHPDITLSAGITVCHSRFPLAQAAEQADRALIKAKHDRDRVCVFDTVLKWPDLEQALDDGRFLDRIMRDCGADGIKATKGFVYRLIRYCQMANETRKLKNLLWRSHLKYDLARNIDRLDKHQKHPPGLERLEKMTALTQDLSQMERLKVAVTYCLYLNRGGKTA